jgi:hypothetical protein
MASDDLLGPIEVAVLDALHRGALRSRCSAVQLDGLRDEPAGEYLLHQVLGHCEEQGLVLKNRDATGRNWTLTRAGRARLRRRHRFARALATLLVRSQSRIG